MNPLERKITPATEPSVPGTAHDSHATGTPTSGLKLKRWAIIAIVIVIIAFIAGAVPRWLHRETLGKETAELATPTVRVITPAPGKATVSLLLPAEVKAFEEAPIYARANGFVKKWYVDIGARVEAGELLVDVDTPELEQQLTGAKAELAQAEAGAALAKITGDRWAELLKTSSVSQQENEEKQADMKLKLAAVDTAKANVHRLEDLHAFTHVKAPFAGTITVRAIDIGDLITSGKELFRLADTSKLRVFVRVPQSATPGIAAGVAAEMTVAESPGHKFTARVVRTAGAIDANSRTLLTELEVDNSKHEILPGSYAEVSFSDVKQDPSIVLPSNTLLFRSEGLKVAVVTNGQTELRAITIGRDFGKTVEVLNGITVNDRVIINPVDSLVSGIPVHVTENPAPESAK